LLGLFVMKSYKQTAELIRSGLADIKAEVIIADLIDKGIEIEKILIIPDGLFRRNYSKDVLDVYADMVRDLIVFHIARDGFYDVLPEGLFHSVIRFNNQDADLRKKEFEKQKQEEEYARKFFMPFDNELLNQRVNLELESLKQTRDPLTISKRFFFNDISIPDEYSGKITALLPFTNEIKGDLELTAFCLSEILGKQITCSSYYSYIKNEMTDPNFGSSGGNNILGENLICSDNFLDNSLTWEFSIILENESDLPDYADQQKGHAGNLISRYYDFFVPFEIELETKIICNVCSPFILGDDKGFLDTSESKHHEVYLGFNTSI
jgi:hypothetical protein